jgi:hypothetical protein
MRGMKRRKVGRFLIWCKESCETSAVKTPGNKNPTFDVDCELLVREMRLGERNKQVWLQMCFGVSQTTKPTPHLQKKVFSKSVSYSFLSVQHPHPPELACPLLAPSSTPIKIKHEQQINKLILFSCSPGPAPESAIDFLATPPSGNTLIICFVKPTKVSSKP